MENYTICIPVFCVKYLKFICFLDKYHTLLFIMKNKIEVVAMEKIEYSDSLATQAYDILLEYIFAHKLPAGTRLIDSQLAQELGISRTPVREAIRHLVEDGLVEVRNVRNYYVACPTEKNMYDIYELRQILDEAVVRKLSLTILPHNSEARSIIYNLRQRTLEQTNFSGATFCKEDEYFHDQITALVQNQELIQCYSQLRFKTRIYRAFTSDSPSRVQRSYQGHLRLCNALLALDLEEALASVEEHVRMSIEYCLEDLQQLEIPKA